MRPIFVLLMSIGLLFGMNWFLGLNPAGSGHSHRELQVIEAPGEYAVDLTISFDAGQDEFALDVSDCLLYTSPSPRDATLSRMPSSA